MGIKVKNCTEEYKSTIVKLFNSGKTYSELNNEYVVTKTTIKQWVTKHEKKNNGTEVKEQNIKEDKILDQAIYNAYEDSKGRYGAVKIYR